MRNHDTFMIPLPTHANPDQLTVLSVLFRAWLKSAASLAVIMGLTWIFGVLIVEVEELVPLAYIYTILVAFQGMFIFLTLVIFSKPVREAYMKWWRAKVKKSTLLKKHFGDVLSSKTVSALLKALDLILCSYRY